MPLRLSDGVLLLLAISYSGKAAREGDTSTPLPGLGTLRRDCPDSASIAPVGSVIYELDFTSTVAALPGAAATGGARSVSVLESEPSGEPTTTRVGSGHHPRAR